MKKKKISEVGGLKGANFEELPQIVGAGSFGIARVCFRSINHKCSTANFRQSKLVEQQLGSSSSDNDLTVKPGELPNKSGDS
jgi:hypothetical protein